MKRALGGGGNGVNPSGDDAFGKLLQKSSPQWGEEAILSVQERTLGVQVRGALHFGSKRRKVAFTLAEGATRVAHWKNSRKIAFTLAEVLITLGIIGIVVALTIPTIVNKYQSYVLKQQFRKAYSTFYNAIKLVQKDEQVACWYWDKRPYETIECTARNEYGTCVKWAMPNNQPTPSDYNGRFDDCPKFYENLRKTMKAVKYCPNNALKNGCITDNYKGMDKVNLEKNPDVAQDPEQSFSDSNMKNRYPAFITSDGVVYMYWSENISPFFMFDINGHKGPNKWGYDIFDFSLRGNPNDGITKIGGVYGYTEKGGKDMNRMIREF